MKTKLLLNFDFDFDEIEAGHSCDRCKQSLTESSAEVFDMLPKLENSLSDDVKKWF